MTEHGHDRIETRAVTSTGVDLGQLAFGDAEVDKTGADLALQVAERCFRVGLSLRDTVDIVAAVTGTRPTALQVAGWSLLWGQQP